jgi:crotonobetaine/carnitine-CoA ligase
MTLKHMPDRMNIHTILKEKADACGDQPFFHFREEHFSYRDLDEESDKVAAGLQSLGISKGDKVAIIMDNRPEFLFLWFGLSKLGAVEVPVNTAHKGDLLIHMIDTADCCALVVESTYLDRVAPVLKALPKVKQLLVLSKDGQAVPQMEIPCRLWCDITANDGRFNPVEVLNSDPLAVMFTSGTTGPSKGALMPQNYALFMGKVCMECCAYTEQDCLYNTLPLFHGNAQFLSTMPALMSGARMVLSPRFSASGFWPDIKKHGCTEFNYIGGILPILLKADPKTDDADNPLRVMFGGGCPPDLFDEVEKRFGVTLLEGYGMSEIGLPLLNTMKSRKKGTCGRPVYGCRLKLVDDYGMEVPPGVPGELLIRNEEPFTMMIEYYNMPQKTVEAWRDLWFNTGDYLVADSDGFFNFVDRKKDALRRRGENISSQEVEKVVNSHVAVLESAAIGVKSQMAEDEVMICVRLKDGQSLSPEALLDYCQERMAYFMVPRFVRFMDELPKTRTQKILKSSLRDQGVTRDTWDREAENYELKR